MLATQDIVKRVLVLSLVPFVIFFCQLFLCHCRTQLGENN